MEKMQNACECENPCSNELQVTSEESQCCIVLSKEINNTNILELNKLSFNKDVKFQITDSFLSVKLPSELSHNFTLEFLPFYLV